MNDKELVEVGEQTIRRGRGGNANFPSSMIGAKAEDVTKSLSNCMQFYKQERVRTDEECEERLDWYFKTCIETGQLPTVEKMALALGITRSILWQWENGNGVSQERSNVIKKAKENLAAFDAEMASHGAVNPVIYIFRAKNYHGMKDQQDVVVTPSQPLGEVQSRAELEAKLADVVIESE